MGAGKSTWIRNRGLEAYTVGSDDIRMLLSGPVLNIAGRMMINPNNEERVWSMLFEIVERRMDRGEFIIVDATFQRLQDFKKFTDLAQKHFYELACVDFSSVDAKTCIEQNLKRPEYKQVPATVIERAIDRITSTVIPSSIKAIDHKDTDAFSAWFEEPTHNLDKYKKIHHIGDLQGCCTVAKEYIDNAGGFKDDEFYIFVGDYVDRGIENAQVLQWLVKETLKKDNVVWLAGNHERHLFKMANGETSRSEEFNDYTYPQLAEAGLKSRDARQFVTKLKDFYRYTYKGATVIVTHAGVSTNVYEPTLVPSEQYWKGVGYYEEPIDKTFTQNVKQDNIYQVHGHRNRQNVRIDEYERSFNLEGKVEFGQFLRVVVLDNSGFAPIYIKNHVFKEYKEQKHYRRASKKNTDAHWLDDVNSSKKISDKTINMFRDHPLIKGKTFEEYPHITSYNFTKKAFYDKKWDDINVKARGLFVNSKTNEVVARSYEKFFNINEREETKLENLERNLSFPVDIFIKENGYLGILGYDSQTDKLFFASKSTPNGDFAIWFKQIILKGRDAAFEESLKNYLREQEASMVFEVIDIQNDPHIIEYLESKVILLDIVHRSEKFEKVSYDLLSVIGERFGFEVKRKLFTCKSWKDFMGWYDNALKENELLGKNNVEGVVIEDLKGFMTKIKYPFYSFWKYMRSARDRIKFCRANDKVLDLSRYGQNKHAIDVVRWMQTLDDRSLESGMIELRKRYISYKDL